MSARIVPALKAAAIGSLVAIVVLSWVPGSERPHTGANTQLEHCAAYLIATILNLMAFVPPRPLGAMLIGMIALAGICEVGQNFTPGRVPQVIDFLAGSSGGLAGAALFALLRRRGMMPWIAAGRRR